MAISKSRGKSESPRKKAVRSLTCGQVMVKAHVLPKDASVADALERITKHDWDHVFIVNSEGVPIGRIHAVDILKIIARKTVNRDIAWMHAMFARELITQASITMKQNTPLLKAAALMLSQDINQLAVVDAEGAITGVVSHSTVARHLPRFIL